MKTLFTLLALSLTFTFKTFAQCSPSIPAGAIVIKTTQTVSGFVSSYWVCKGATLTATGQSETIYLESGASVIGSGLSQIVYAPAGAKVTSSSQSGTVYYVNTADLLSVTGLGETKTPCTSITYNYTNAPASGCPKCVSSGTTPTSISSSTGNGFCAGKSTTLTQVGGTLNTGAQWQWCSGSCTGTVIGTGASVTVTPTATTTYYVKTIGDSCNTACTSLTLTLTTGCACTSNGVNPTGISSSTGNGFCAGKSTTLTQVGGTLNAGAQWAWSTGSCTGTVIDSGASIVVAPTAATTYFVKAIRDACHTTCTPLTLTPSTGCACTSTGVNPTGISSSTGSGACSGKPTTLSEVGGTLNTGAQWAWSTGSCAGAVIDSGASIVVAPTTTTTYFVKAIRDACHTNCSSTTLSPASILTPIIYGPPSLCPGQNSTLSVVNSPCVGAACIYNWSNGDTGITVPIAQSATTTYTVTVSNGCKDSVKNTITIAGGSKLPANISSSSGVYACPGKPSTLTETGGALSAGAQWFWYTGSCGGTLIDSGAAITVTPSASSSYYIRSVRGKCGNTSCDSTKLSIVSLLTPVISGTLSLCPGQPTTLSVVNSPCVGGGCIYKWSGGDTGISVIVTPASLPVTYTVTVSNACKDSVKSSITINIASSCATGIAAFAGNAGGINIMPNPSHGDFTISMPAGAAEKSIIRIYNMLGDEVPFTSSEKASGKNNREISLQHKGSGLYFIRVQTGEKSYSMKLIIN